MPTHETLEQAQQLLQDAYDLDCGTRQVVYIPEKQIAEIGVLNIHYVYYNGGLSALPDIRDHLREYPTGHLVTILREVVERRVAAGDYSQETLERIYGLTE